MVTVETFGSTFDTVLAVYTGSAVSALTPIASNDNHSGSTQSKLTFQAQEGTTYFIAVDGRNIGGGAPTGGITLSLSLAIPVAPGTTALVYFSHPGDYIGGGVNRQLHAGQDGVTISASRHGQGNRGVYFGIRVGNFTEWWDLYLGPPPAAGVPLAVGSYENAVRYTSAGGLSPGLDLGGNGRGCNTIRGRFDVLEAIYAVDGSVQRFAADFVQHCEGGLRALFGQIRFNSEVPLSLESALPAPFDFVDAVDVEPSVPVTSDSVTITGIAQAPVSVQGGEYSIDGAPFASTPGIIRNGQTLAVRLMSSSLPGTASFVTVRVGAAAATFQATTALGAQGTNLLYFHSQPGDWIGQGQQRALHAGTGYTLAPSRNYHNGVTFTINGPQGWHVDFAAPGRAPLAVGVYENAVRFPFENGTSPGVSLGGDGRGCNAIRGRFEVLDIAYAADGTVQRFAADFAQRCVEGGMPALFGQVRWNSNIPIYTEAELPAPFAFFDQVDVPLGSTIVSNTVQISGITSAPIRVLGGEYSVSGQPFTSAPGTITNGQTVQLRLVSSTLPGTAAFATIKIGAAAVTFQATSAIAEQGANVFYYHSQPGDFVGDGRREALHAGNGWTLRPSRNYHNGITFDLEGNGGWWRIDLAAAGGDSAPALAVRSYENAVRFPFENGTSPGLSASNGGGCNTLRGRFDVLEVAYGADGSVQRFAANFVQHCEGVAPALFGQLRYNSNVPIYVAPVLPAPFGFVDALDVPRGVFVNSNAVRIGGITSAPIRVQGGEYSIDGAAFTSAAGTIANGQTVALRLMSSTLPASATFATVSIGAASATFQATTAIAPGTNALHLRSMPGDYIGEGKTRTLHAGNGFTFTPRRNWYNGIFFHIPGGADSWSLDFAAAGEPPTAAPPLARGAYENAARMGWAGRPGIDIGGGSRGCSQTAGRFDVLEVVYGDGGAVSSFAANFEQRCDGLSAPLFGRIRYNTLVPLFNARRDHDGDGRSDILWRNASTGENYLFPMDGTQVLAGEGYLRGVADPAWQIAGTGDFNGDGRADILWRNSITGENYVYLMNGRLVAGEGYLRRVADTRWQVAGIGDFDGDGKDDIVWRNAGTGENYIYAMDGVSIKPNEGYLRTAADTRWKLAGVGDFDGDGKADILWRHSASGEIYIWFMQGTSIVREREGPLRTVANMSWEVKGVGDLDGDGRADIVWRNASTGENYAYLMNGLSVAKEGYLNTVPDANWQIAAVGDYDGDGKADILWRNLATGHNYLYPMDGLAIRPADGYLRSVPPGDWQVVGK
jgi:hypothetical protein